MLYRKTGKIGQPPKPNLPGESTPLLQPTDLPVKQNDVTNVQQQAVSPLPAPPAKQDQIKDHGNKRKRKKDNGERGVF